MKPIVRVRTRILLILFGLMITFVVRSSLVAQESNATSVQGKDNETAVQEQAEAGEVFGNTAESPSEMSLKANGSAAQKNVTLDFKDADIRNVLKIISYKAGVNIVVTPDVVGNVNMRLVDVPWQNALDTIVKTYGFGYEWLNDRVIMVSTLARLAEQRKSQEEAMEKEPLDTDTFVLNFSSAIDIKNVLDKLLSARGKITVESRTNTLIVTDTKSTLLKIKEAIQRLDKMTPQVMIEARIIETTLGSSEKLGIDWNLRVALSGPKRPTTWPFTGEIKGAGSKYFPKTTVPTSLVREATTTYSETGAVVGTSYSENTYHSLVAGFPDVPTGLFTFGTLDMTGLQAVLEVLKSSSDTKIISNPRITTLNNQEAKILVGKVVPIPKYEYSKETGALSISGYEDKEVGVKLIVTPNINEQEYVTLSVKPSVEAIIGSTGPNGERPVISTRSAETNVMIKNGQTLVIGGLISEDKIKSKNGIPILGSLPLLKYLFGRKEDTITKTEMLIFITPHIIREKKPLLEKAGSEGIPAVSPTGA
ncbi:MAG: type IV pilus secretin PilQ [Candidatus Omnitrophota bacterium]|jgi:type IV pilus assembly protein PilQ|nr:MAG: type IV pilus secretin PilQ [Candidatus Omnitrophota bacterium]